MTLPSSARLAAILFCLTPASIVTAEPPITCLRFAVGGQQLIVTSQKGLQVLDWPHLKLQRTIEFEASQICDAQFNATGSNLYVAGGEPGENGLVVSYVWPELKPKWTATVSEDVVYQLTVSADEQQVAAAAHNHVGYILEAEDGKILRELKDHSQPVVGIQYLNNGQIATCSVDQSIRIWNAESGAVVRSLGNHTQPVTQIAPRPAIEGLPMIASGGEDRTVRLWQPTIGRMVRFKRLNTIVQAVAWTGNGEFVICGCRDGTVVAINADTLETVGLHTSSQTRITCLVRHPEGNALVAGCGDGSICTIKLDALLSDSSQHP